MNPVDIAKSSIEHAAKNGNNIVILDTAGRLHIDEDMMTELIAIKQAVDVHQTILIDDAMTGQDAVNVAKDFNKKSSRRCHPYKDGWRYQEGGAALSISFITETNFIYWYGREAG